MSKRVWLVSHYAMPPHLEQRVKTLRFAQILQERGYDVLLITASTIHNTDINLISDHSLYTEQTYDGLKYVHIRCSPYRGSGIKRIRNLYQFHSRFGKVMKRFAKPDVIVADCNCVNYYGLQKFAHKYDIPFIVEIRDLWPLSIVEYKGISPGNPVIRYLYGQEKRMYRHASAIIFSMEGGKQYIIDKGWDKTVNLDKVFYINNGIDVKVQEEQAKTIVTEDAQLDDSTFKVVYAGSIRIANNVEKLVKAAEIVGKQREDVSVLIYGEGDDKSALEQYCREKGVTNVFFKGSVAKAEIPYILSKCNLAILTYKQADTWKYGGSQNKLFDYLNAGLPVIANIKMGYSLLEKSGCGTELNTDNAETMAQAILDYASMDEEQYRLLRNKAKAAAADYDFEILTDRLEEAIKYACGNKQSLTEGKENAVHRS